MKTSFYKGGQIGEATALSALMYDAVKLIDQAAKNAGGKTDPDSLVKGLQAIKGYSGLMGKVDYSTGHEGWPIENISVAKADSFNPEYGTYTRAPGAVCGVA